jgi:uncharacterized lipoprotein
LVVGLAAVAGCSRQETVSCNSDARYTTARSAQPVQIPDDLSPPNETDALRLPPDVGSGTGPGPCLQSPPSFFGESRPFQVDAEESSRRARREARREERREARGEATVDAPAGTTEPQPAPSDAAQESDRVIEN